MDDESSRKHCDSGKSAPAGRGDLEGARVLILTGKFKGNEGVCLGAASADDLWAVSPDGIPDILSLAFEKDFALLVDLSADPTRN
jgi:hypothetical protein